MIYASLPNTASKLVLLYYYRSYGQFERELYWTVLKQTGLATLRGPRTVDWWRRSRWPGCCPSSNVQLSGSTALWTLFMYGTWQDLEEQQIPGYFWSPLPHPRPGTARPVRSFKTRWGRPPVWKFSLSKSPSLHHGNIYCTTLNLDCIWQWMDWYGAPSDEWVGSWPYCVTWILTITANCRKHTLIS